MMFLIFAFLYISVHIRLCFLFFAFFIAHKQLIILLFRTGAFFMRLVSRP